MSEVPFLVINLDRSPERWQSVREKAVVLGLDVRRISALDGAAVPREDWISVDVAAFARQHGRTIFPGEYGCYRSHLKALEAVEAYRFPYAVILEDDALPNEQTAPRIQSIIDTLPHFDLVKLVNHRTSGFVEKWTTPLGDQLGRTIHGPQGSAAAYLVSLSGTKKMRSALETMTLPWDIAFERYWAIDLEFYSVKENVLDFVKGRGSQIAPEGYRKSKFPKLKRLPTLVFRAEDYVRRVLGATISGPPRS